MHLKKQCLTGSILDNHFPSNLSNQVLVPQTQILHLASDCIYRVRLWNRIMLILIVPYQQQHHLKLLTFNSIWRHSLIEHLICPIQILPIFLLRPDDSNFHDFGIDFP